MKMKIKKDASNNQIQVRLLKIKKRYIYDNLIRNPCFPKERSINKQ